MPIFWSARARADLAMIGDYIAADTSTAAARWVGRLIEAVELAATQPLAGRRVPELARDDLREVLLRTYRIVYSVAEKGILVLTVFESHRQFPEGLGQRGGSADEEES